jgi:hypothetical protein
MLEKAKSVVGDLCVLPLASKELHEKLCSKIHSFVKGLNNCIPII